MSEWASRCGPEASKAPEAWLGGTPAITVYCYFITLYIWQIVYNLLYLYIYAVIVSARERLAVAVRKTI